MGQKHLREEYENFHENISVDRKKYLKNLADTDKNKYHRTKEWKTKIKILKAPKKPKRPILKSKGRVSSLLDLDNVFEKENMKRLQIQINNQLILHR